jgi:hypothetical protein
LNLESGDLRAKNISGPMSLTTRSKDIHMENVAGDLKIENSNGMVEYNAGSKLGQVDITNSRGNVQVTVPPRASFQLDARTRRGEVHTDFSIPVQSDRQEQSANGSVGTGGPQLRLVNNGGDVEVRKAGVVSSEPGNEAAPSGPGTSPLAPKAPKAPKPPKGTATTSLDDSGPFADSAVLVPTRVVMLRTGRRQCLFGRGTL